MIVTHHLPSMQSVAARFKNDVPSAAYASHLDELVANSNAALWIHGHAHNSSDYVIGGTRVLCNPRGYASFALNRQFSPKLVVEV